MKLKPLKIGNLTIDVPVLLAPMAGYTTPAFRLICQKLGSGLNYTEMVPTEGIRRKLPQTMFYLDTLPEEGPLAAHIYGTRPDAFAIAAETVESLGRFDLIDINCGCPVRKIAGGGAGVSLMKDPEKLHAIICSTVENTSLPVTVKTRLGISEDSYNLPEIARVIEEAGASAITIHARFATQRHSGPVNFEALKQIKSERSIPVIGNGGIKNAEQALEMIEKTGVDGIMIGQGTIGNPWIFREILFALKGKRYSQPSAEERKAVMAEHLQGLYHHISSSNKLRKHPSDQVERLACEAFRGHMGKYLRGMRGVKNLQGNLMQIETIEEVVEAIGKILEVNEV